MILGSPADPNYRKHYFDLWKAVAEHIKARNAWYRALAYVKVGGLNLFTQEARLPNRCECECEICNTEVWATEGDYTPSVLYDYYKQMTALLAQLFPEKSMNYMLIQDGFPQVNDLGEYLTSEQQTTTQPLMSGVDQTRQILKQGREEHMLRFVVAHNGLGPTPDFRGNDSCPNQGLYPAPPPYAKAGSGCPNRWILEAGYLGLVTGSQTNNSRGVYDPETLESTFVNAWDKSDGIYVEIYEQRLWQAEKLGPQLPSGQTIADWDELFHSGGEMTGLTKVLLIRAHWITNMSSSVPCRTAVMRRCYTTYTAPDVTRPVHQHTA